MREECKNLKGRMKDICNGDADLPLHVINKYRKFWGLEPFSGALFKKEKNTKNFRAAKKGCNSCNKRRGAAKQAVKFQDALSKYDGITSEQEMQSRLETCAACPLLQGNICNACGCDVNDKVKKRTEQCPAYKWFPEIRESRKLNNPTKNLIMHIFPVSDLNSWQLNVKEVAKRQSLFNGKRIVSVATMKEPKKIKTRPNRILSTDSFDSVVNEFKKYNMHIDEFIHYENNDRLREVITFPRALEKIQSKNSNEVTFSCHSKGSSYGLDSICLEWAQVMYHTCLDDWTTVKNALELYSMAGPFRRFGQFSTPYNNRWHYSGTFYWFRHDDVFSRNWKKIDKKFFGTESWPGLMFTTEECACIFADDANDLYKHINWENSFRPEMEMWDGARK
jgi:hypothetical protein